MTALPCTTPYGFITKCQNLRKSNDPIPRKCLDRQTDGLTEGQTDSVSLLPLLLIYSMLIKVNNLKT